MMKGVANQSWSNTSPSGQTKVTLNPTGGAGDRSEGSVLQSNIFNTRPNIVSLLVNFTAGAEAYVADDGVSLDMDREEVSHRDSVEVGLVWRLLVDLKDPAVSVTGDPSHCRLETLQSSLMFHLIMNGSSVSMVEPSPGSPWTSSVRLLWTPHLLMNSCPRSTQRWKASSVPLVAK